MKLVKRYYEDSPIRLGKFRCPASYPSFENTGPARGYLVVFPRETVEITHEGGMPIVANPNVLMFYNDQQEYRRRKISDRGDRCDFFDIDHALLLDSIRRFCPQVEDDYERPFRFASRTISDKLYLRQRQLVDHVERSELDCSQLDWDEKSIWLVDQVIEEAFLGQSTNAKSIALKSHHFDLVFDAQHFVSRHFAENVTLEQIAEAIDSSAYHLCRVFSQACGISIHQYVTRIRMRSALEMIRGGSDLTSIAFDLGYSSHSHFTSVFRRTFGMTPRQWRNA